MQNEQTTKRDRWNRVGNGVKGVLSAVAFGVAVGVAYKGVIVGAEYLVKNTINS